MRWCYFFTNSQDGLSPRRGEDSQARSTEDADFFTRPRNDALKNRGRRFFHNSQKDGSTQLTFFFDRRTATLRGAFFTAFFTLVFKLALLNMICDYEAALWDANGVPHYNRRRW